MGSAGNYEWQCPIAAQRSKAKHLDQPKIRTQPSSSECSFFNPSTTVKGPLQRRDGIASTPTSDPQSRIPSSFLFQRLKPIDCYIHFANSELSRKFRIRPRNQCRSKACPEKEPQDVDRDKQPQPKFQMLSQPKELPSNQSPEEHCNGHRRGLVAAIPREERCTCRVWVRTFPHQ